MSLSPVEIRHITFARRPFDARERQTRLLAETRRLRVQLESVLAALGDVEAGDARPDADEQAA